MCYCVVLVGCSSGTVLVHYSLLITLCIVYIVVYRIPRHANVHCFVCAMWPDYVTKMLVQRSSRMSAYDSQPTSPFHPHSARSSLIVACTSPPTASTDLNIVARRLPSSSHCFCCSAALNTTRVLRRPSPQAPLLRLVC